MFPGSNEKLCTTSPTPKHLQAAPVLDHQPLELWAVFCAVAQRRGYQAVSALRWKIPLCISER